MTGSSTRYRILMSSRSGAIDWFPVMYGECDVARVAAKHLVSGVPDVDAATVCRCALSDAAPAFEDAQPIGVYIKRDKT